MDIDNQTSTEQGMAKTFWRKPIGIALITAMLILIFFLLREHWGHVFGFWPYLILLACPLMHLMHGHGDHHHSSQASQSSDSNKTSSK
jgi:hypothetical protein